MGCATQSTAGEQLPHHTTSRFVRGAAADGQRPVAEQLPHALRPPALKRSTLFQQIGNRPLALDEHNALSQQPGFEDIAMGRETTSILV